MPYATSHLLTSTIPLPDNAVKSLIFRVSALLLQLAVLKILTLVAHSSGSFTPYLIFSESLPQKLRYILRRRSALVLTFLVLSTAAGFFDTVLWGIDHPGLVTRSRIVSASTLTAHRRSNSPYVISTQSSPGDVSTLDPRADLSAGLYTQINTSLASVTPGNPTPYLTPLWKLPSGITPTTNGTTDQTAGSNYPGSRIYLDDEGWSVSVNFLFGIVASFACPEVFTTDLRGVSWNCNFTSTANSRAAMDYLTQPLGYVAVWWSAEQGIVQYENVVPERGVNPWQVLGTGGDTAAMKSIFSLTKGNVVNTFMLSSMKISLLAPGATTLNISDINTLLTRTWPSTSPQSLLTSDMASITAALQTGNSSLTLGRTTSTPTTVETRVYQLLLPPSGYSNTPIYSIFQILTSTLTLISTTTISTPPPRPAGSCDVPFSNQAYGGVVTGTNCYVAVRGNGIPPPRFLGTVDQLVVWVLIGALGATRAGTAADALDVGAWGWYRDNEAMVEEILIARAYVAGGRDREVQVEVFVVSPGMSVVQIVLVSVAVVLLMAVWGGEVVKVKGEFTGSLLMWLEGVAGGKKGEVRVLGEEGVGVGTGLQMGGGVWVFTGLAQGGINGDEKGVEVVAVKEEGKKRHGIDREVM